MGDAPPYTKEELNRLLSGTVFVTVKHYGQTSVTFLLESRDQVIELEVEASADWPGASDHVATSEIVPEVTVYVRGAGDE